MYVRVCCAVLVFVAGTTANIKVVTERLKAKTGQRIFLFNSLTLNSFFDGDNAADCDYGAQVSMNATINGVDASYLDVNDKGNCEGTCTVSVDVIDVPNIQFLVVQCSESPEKVDLDFRITSSNAVACADASTALSSLPWIVGICVLVVVDIAMLGVTFLLYRRKVQLEELKI